MPSETCSQAPEGDRPARHRHFGNAVLPLVTRLAAQVIDRSCRQADCGTLEAAPLASAEPHCRGRAKRNPDHVFKYQTIAMPANPGSDVVANEQRLNEFVRLEPSELCGPSAQRQQPRGNRFGGGKARRIEIVVPAKRCGKPLAEPSVETEENLLRLSVGLDESVAGSSPFPRPASGIGFGERYVWQ